jgi:hypothetical protein
MFSFHTPKTQHNNQLRILSSGLINNQIDYELVIKHLKKQQNDTLVDFLSNYRREQERLWTYYDRYQQSTLMKKEAYIDYHLRCLSEESLMCIYNVLRLPYAQRVELAPYLKYTKQQRMALALQYPQYEEILFCSLYLREKLHAILITKNDAIVCEKAHHIFAYLGPIMPFNRKKYQELLEKQVHHYRLFKEMLEKYELKMSCLKLEVLKFLVTFFEKNNQMSHLHRATTAQINAVKTKQSYAKELSGDEDCYGQFVDIEDADDIVLLEIEKVRSRSPTSVASSFSSRSIFKMDVKIDEEAYMPSAFTIAF